MKRLPRLTDPDVEFNIRPSNSPITVDGYALGEPMELDCPHCSAFVRLTERRGDPGATELTHDRGCPYADGLE